ncbi:MAG: polysaccharide deacetylase family protein [Actinomycetota bacterium]|jgi:peptidoglycan/xylan/chitin deacetylase (PgdA/CDA1 family)|uniref:polysaccharide deacetylase family protein n=1 Tax=Pseudonocardia TaxID=1847 RepID=UPI00307FC510
MTDTTALSDESGRAQEPLRLAVTLDDPFMWRGAGFPAGYDPDVVLGRLCDAFERYRVPEVYAFTSTAPVEDHPQWLSALDRWTARGHHVAAHTHSHASLNWTDVPSYVADLDRNLELLEPWLAKAPTRYFRYAFDMWGDTRDKTDRVQTHLARRGLLPAPITHWFYDVQFLVAYLRTLSTGDTEAAAWVRRRFAETAVDALLNQAAAAREVFGRQPAHIALVHGTPIAADAYAEVLAGYAAAGVRFITLEEAMSDPANQIVPPTVTRYFRNSTQKWAEHAGIGVADTPPRILNDVQRCCPVEGMTESDLLGPALVAAALAVGSEPVATDLDWNPAVDA